MSKKINQQEDPEVQIEQAINRSEHFIEKNGKKLLIALCVVVVVLGCYFGYTNLVKSPKEQKAAEVAYVAQQLFGKGDFAQALNGDGNNAGFLDVIKNYGSTAAGNTAAHYAGICYIKMGDFKTAITYLEKYKDVEGTAAAIINAQNKGLIGDAYVELKENAKAISFYEKAVAASDNQLTTPYYLMKVAGVYEANGDTVKALAAYEKIKNTYFESMEARDIDKYIGKLTK